jgi:hypothetical protein
MRVWVCKGHRVWCHSFSFDTHTHRSCGALSEPASTQAECTTLHSLIPFSTVHTPGDTPPPRLPNLSFPPSFHLACLPVTLHSSRTVSSLFALRPSLPCTPVAVCVCVQGKLRAVGMPVARMAPLPHYSQQLLSSVDPNAVPVPSSVDEDVAAHRAALEHLEQEVCVVSCCVVLCCAVLCCAVLCCAVLCCAVLCCAVLCCAVLCCVVSCCVVLCCVVLCCAACVPVFMCAWLYACGVLCHSVLDDGLHLVVHCRRNARALSAACLSHPLLHRVPSHPFHRPVSSSRFIVPFHCVRTKSSRSTWRRYWRTCVQGCSCTATTSATSR